MVLSCGALRALLPQHGAEDVSQFDSRFTKMPVVDSPVETSISESANMAFKVSLQFARCSLLGSVVWRGGKESRISYNSHAPQEACMHH